MYGCLLALVFIFPFSFAYISILQGILFTAWVINGILLKLSSRKGCPSYLDFTANSMFWPLLAIGLLIALTIPFSHYPALSLKKFGTRFIFQVLLMCTVIQVVRSRKRLYSVLAVLFFAVFLTGVDALLQYKLGYDIVHHTAQALGRVSGSMNSANDLGTLLVTVLPVVLVLIFTKFSKTQGERAPWAAVMVVLYLVLASVLGLTVSRGAWVAFAISSMALAFCFRRPKIIFSMVLMLVVFFWAFGMYCLSHRIDIYDVGMTHGPVMKPSWANPWGLPAQYHPWELLFNSSGRQSYWDKAIVVIKKYPWFGCGYSAYLKTLNDMHFSGTEYPHNSLLHITAELGIVGLLFYLWLFVALCLQAWRVLREVSGEKDLYTIGCGISCGILAWMIHSLLDTPWSSLQLSVLLWLVIGILNCLSWVKRGLK
jgi:O-antigen ligase